MTGSGTSGGVGVGVMPGVGVAVAEPVGVSVGVLVGVFVGVAVGTPFGYQMPKWAEGWPPAVIRLRQLLKLLHRAYRFRVVAAVESTGEPIESSEQERA